MKTFIFVFYGVAAITATLQMAHHAPKTAASILLAAVILAYTLTGKKK